MNEVSLNAVRTPAFWDIRSRYEIVFSVFLLMLAFLFRDLPSIVYPDILFVFLVFLAFNLLYNRFLRQKAIPSLPQS